MKPDIFVPKTQLARWMDIASLATGGAALLVAGSVLIIFQFILLRNALLEDVSMQARIISENSVAALLFADRDASRETLEVFEASSSIEAAGIFTIERTPLAVFQHEGMTNIETPSNELIETGHQFGLDYLEVAHPVRLDTNTIGFVVLRANLNQLYSRLLGYGALTLLIAACSLALAYLLVARMRRTVKNAEAHLSYLAHVDSVTGLPNRHTFNQRLSSALEKVDAGGGTVGLLLLDLDNFKIINDTLGHHNGDLLLKVVAQRLHRCLRGSDILCRIGGDEFAIILESAGAINSTDVAEKILSVLAAPFDVTIHEIYVTASVGISLYPQDASDLETLTRNADTAMYQAKGRGKNAYEKFHPELDQRVQKRLSLETSLHKALERGELSLHYQPQINLRDGSLVGVEALLRWHHPELGMISPAEFIPVAEESGLIVQVGRWALRNACRQMALWRDAGYGCVQVSVNLSPRQTRDNQLVHDIINALRDYNLSPSQLELEITETVLMENVHANVDLLHRLQTEGIRLSIDDFGTGYSSMAYLKRFPIDQVKVDRTFIRDIPGDGDDEAITTAIIAMAHSLGLSVVAEGVETAMQLEFLRTAGCDIIQGFYFSQPKPPQQIEEFLKQRSVPMNKAEFLN
jgi:diguanylate cyclase (GGDEF)-like protein